MAPTVLITKHRSRTPGCGAWGTPAGSVAARRSLVPGPQSHELQLSLPRGAPLETPPEAAAGGVSLSGPLRRRRRRAFSAVAGRLSRSRWPLSRIERMGAQTTTARSGAASSRWCRSGSGSCRSRSPTPSRPAAPGLSLVETQALSALVFAGSAQFTAVGLFASGVGRGEHRPDDAPPQHPPSALRRLGRAPVRSQPPSAAGRGLLPHRRGVRRRLGHRRAGVPVPARRRAQPLRHVEPRHASAASCSGRRFPTRPSSAST